LAGPERVVLESGTLSPWHWHGLRALTVPVVCVDARQAKAAALSARVHKSDDLDAEGLAQRARAGWYAEVRLKSLESRRLHSVLAARAKLGGAGRGAGGPGGMRVRPRKLGLPGRAPRVRF